MDGWDRMKVIRITGARHTRKKIMGFIFSEEAGIVITEIQMEIAAAFMEAMIMQGLPA